MTAKDIKVGDVFGKWTVLVLAPHTRNCRCTCRCECGEEGNVAPFDLVSGKSTRCRVCALSRPRRANRNRLYASIPCRKKLLASARNAIIRCIDPTHRRFKDWGGRGIRVHAPWIDDAISFVEYLSTLDGHDNPAFLLDRIDNDGHYEPGNLRFVSRSDSQLNRRVESEHAYYMQNGFARCFKKLHDGGLSFEKIGDLYCAQLSTVRNCVRELESA